MFYGLDIHKKFIQVCCLSDDGKKRTESKISTELEVLEKFTQSLTKEDSVVMEVTFVTGPFTRL